MNKQTPRGLQTLLVISLGIFTAICPTALSTFSLRQFETLKVNGQTIWKTFGAFGSAVGASKAKRGNWKTVGQRPTEMIFGIKIMERLQPSPIEVPVNVIRMLSSTWFSVRDPCC